MERDFRYLKEQHGEAGARDLFEKICTELLQARYGNDAHNIRVSHGDGGIDILVGDLTKPIDNYQCKYFINGVGKSQKDQIRKSFKRAIETDVYKMNKWVLCVPCNFTVQEMAWWNKWREEQYNKYKIKIELCDGGYLITQLKKYSIYEKAFDDDIRQVLDKILVSIECSQSNIVFQDELEATPVPYDIDVEELESLFVETKPYRDILEKLETPEGIIIITGLPGIGKTFSSQMAALHFEKQGYTIRYSDDGDMSEILDILKDQRPEKKEILLLNDFLGQLFCYDPKIAPAYLTKLLNYIKSHENKKLIINSRLTVWNEARKNQKFYDISYKYSDSIYEIKSQLDYIDKADILFSHIKRSTRQGIMTEAYWNKIKDENTLNQIVFHENYTPRIISFLTDSPGLFHKVVPEDYRSFIMQKLDYPEDIWKNEIEQLGEIDRILLYTLYSLTNTNIPKRILSECFENRIKKMSIDCTINVFETVLGRLSDSLIRITITDTKEEIISTVNPSVNDYLKKVISENGLLLKQIFADAVYLEQILRFDSLPAAETYIVRLLETGEFFSYKTLPQINCFGSGDYINFLQRHVLMLKYITLYYNDIKKQFGTITKLLSDLCEMGGRMITLFSHDLSKVFSKLFTEPVISQYDFSSILTNEDFAEQILISVQPEIFWDIWYAISNKYYADRKDRMLSRYKSILIEQIGDFAVNSCYEKRDDIISCYVKDMLGDDLEEMDGYAVADYLGDEIGDEIYDEVNAAIENELAVRKITGITVEDFDVDSLVNEALDLYNRIIEIYEKESTILKPEVQDYIEVYRAHIKELSRAIVF
ncbi:hypothetical protein [Hungatella hathewayi]|uniref:nSTAND3 domain-containing NTPase n=1 Tax=Hungatella hathewayi TaxID=154046 RepID=UPI0011DE4B34|nr:hypothetical protein [Hungatella hathewayi]